MIINDWFNKEREDLEIMRETRRECSLIKGETVKKRRGKLIVASQDPYCFQRIFLRIQYKAISVLLTSDIFQTVWTRSLQVPLLQIGARQIDRLSFEIMCLIFHVMLKVLFCLQKIKSHYCQYLSMLLVVLSFILLLH